MTEKTKLTVRVESRWLQAAKRYAQRNKTSLSKLISEYLHQLATAEEGYGDAPILQRMTGILPPEVSVEEHRDHLADKYKN